MATVLVVDDNAVNREFLRTVLGYRGYEVLEAAGGAEALALARAAHPDAVVTDVLMPGLDGYELARMLRGEPATSRTPIAFWTVHYLEPEVLAVAQACGVQTVILKPSDPTALISAVDRLLADAPGKPRAVTDEEFAREHVHALKAKLVEKSAALDLSEGRFQIIAESSPVGILLGDDEGSAIYANPRLTEITGRPLGELLGTGWLAWVDQRLRGEIRAALRQGPPYASHRHRARMEDATGAALWLDIHLQPFASDGEPAGFVALVDDVTAVVQAEERRRVELEREAEMLRRTAQLAHRLTEAERLAHLGTWELDVEAGILSLSPELRQLLGLPSLTWRQEELRRRVHPDDTERVKAAVERAVLTSEPYVIEYRVTRGDGALRDALTFGEPVPDPDNAAGPVRRLWGVTQDITEVRSAQRTAAQARADWRAEHRLLQLFQEVMLPTELPEVPGAELAATYLAAPDRLDIGGDWYDALRLPDGRILLSIGDIVGHDQRAAATMGPIRAVLRAYAIEDPDPAAALVRLNRFILTGYPAGTLNTAVVAIYQPQTRELRWANAGHPAPLLATLSPESVPGGTVVETLDERGPVLGVYAEVAFPLATRTLAPGAAFCCYTDGLLERRGSTADADETRLVRAVARAFAGASPAQRMVEQITTQMLAPDPPEDDVCLLVLRTSASGEAAW